MTYKEQQQADIIESARKALATQYLSGNAQSDLSELLANLMMYAEKLELDFQGALASAKFHFDCEK